MPASALAHADPAPHAADAISHAAAPDALPPPPHVHTTSSSDSHVPSETNDNDARSQTPTDQPTSSSTSSAGASPGAQVEGKPSPPPGLSPTAQQKQQHFNYNARQAQAQAQAQGQMGMSPQQAAQAHQQHMLMQQQLLMQQHMQFQQQQIMAQQQQQQQQAQRGATQPRADRRQPHPHGSNSRQYAGSPQLQQQQQQQQAHYYAQNQQAAAAAAQAQAQAHMYGNGVSYEMYQQMLFSSGMDAAVLAAGVASGQVFQMYQLACASGLHGNFAYPHPHGPHMHQPDAYAMHMQHAYFNNGPAGVDAAIAGGTVPIPPPQVPSPTPQQRQQGYRMHPKNSPVTAPLLPSPNAYVDGYGYGYASGGQSPVAGQPHMQYPSGGQSPTARDQQLLQEQHHANRQFRDGQHSNGHHAHGGHHHHHHSRSHHRSASEHHEPGSGSGREGYERGAPQPNFKTEICRSHQATGSCEYGSSCQFSHGAHELRSREVDSKFKSDLCKNFHAVLPLRTGPDGTVLPPLPSPPPPHAPHGAHPASGATGSCWYGNRCRFLHDEFRLRHSDNEFWLVAPSDRLIRVERVDEANVSRIEQLLELVHSDHNKRQLMLYAATIPGATNANPAAGVPGSALNLTVFNQHMNMQMQHQLATQGEAQIHVREERAGRGAHKDNEGAREHRDHRDHHHRGGEHHMSAQHGPAVGGDSAVHDAVMAGAGAAASGRMHPITGEKGTGRHNVVAITPIMPLNAHHAAHSHQMQSQAQQLAQAQANASVPAPVVQQPQQPAGQMSYARKVATAAIIVPTVKPVAVKPAPVRPTAAPVAPTPTISTPTVAAATAAGVSPSSASSSASPSREWQTKVSRRDRKGRTGAPSTLTGGGDSHDSSPHKGAAEEHKEAESSSSSDVASASEDDDDLTHIIAKIAEVEMMEKESKERKQAASANANTNSRAGKVAPDMD